MFETPMLHINLEVWTHIAFFNDRVFDYILSSIQLKILKFVMGDHQLGKFQSKQTGVFLQWMLKTTEKVAMIFGHSSTW